MSEPLPIAVLISGGGTNLQALIDAERSSSMGYRIAVVISDRPLVGGLERAAAASIATEVVDWAGFASREAFTDAICHSAEEHGAAGLVLAGFMRILAPRAMQRFPDAIINIHPALLPSFPGARAVPLALEHGVTLTGVTVHFVDEQVDHGPIIAQEAVPVLPGDDADSLHTRIRIVEHRLYPRIVDAFGRGDLRVEGRHVRFAGIDDVSEAVS